MIRQLCNVRPQDIVTTRSNELLAWLGIEDLDLILKERRLSWYGHVERSNGAVKTAFHIQVEGKRGPGRPKMTRKQLTERDCREWKHLAINSHDRNMWRSGVRSAMCAASQLSTCAESVINFYHCIFIACHTIVGRYYGFMLDICVSVCLSVVHPSVHSCFVSG